MNHKLRRRYLAISASVAVTFLLVLATPAAAGKTQLSSRTSSAEAHSKTIDIVGQNVLAINRFVSTTYHFKQGTVHVKQGDTIVLTDQTDDGHSFTLVKGSLLPKTVGDVFGCGAPPPAPANICFPVLAAHFPQGPPQGLPAACLTTNSPPCIAYIDGGQPSSVPPGLDTVFTLTADGSANGDSVVILPGGAISMTVTAQPGSYNFFCAFHSWMQGKLVVDKSEGD